jgi:hypothetical protein
MGSEGELKRQLIKMLDNVTLTATFKPNSPDWQTQTYPLTIHGFPQEDFLKILDLAKADFPKLDRNLEHNAVQDYANQLLKITAWLKKWFGES